MHRLGRIAALAVLGMFLACGAQAELAKPWQLGMSEPASTSMEHIVWLHDFLLIIITVITLFVLALLIIVMVRFNEKANPQHLDRGGVDDDSSADPDRHRRAVAQARLLP